MQEFKVIIIILVVQGLEVNFDNMIFVIVIVGIRLCHSLFNHIIVLIEVHADAPLGSPQDRWSEKFLLSHRLDLEDQEEAYEEGAGERIITGRRDY